MGNIVGLNMESWAVNQIKLRQRLLGTDPRDSRVLSWINNRTAWIRAASPVSISPKKSKELTGEEFKYADRQLAKEFVLFGGTSTINEISPGDSSGGYSTLLRSGVTNNNSIVNNFAYGLGGNQPQGIVPMPGIESLNINTYNRGALRKAELKIKVHNKYQFGIIDALYMKPGYTILLEWGNTIYYTGTPENPTPAEANFNSKPFKNFFAKNTVSQDIILDNIREERKLSEGNYDGFYGKITNFSWTYNTDGSYDITISAISIGDVIESLNVNRVLIEEKSPPTKNSSNTQSSSPRSTYILSGIASNGQTFTREFSESEAKKYKEYWIQQGKTETEAVTEARKAAGGSPKTLTPPPNQVAPEEKIITALLDDKDRTDFNKFLYESIYNYIINNINKNSQTVNSSSNPNVKSTIKTFASALNNLSYRDDGKDIVGINTKVSLNVTNFSGEQVGNQTRASKNFPFLYIKLGSLLKYIQENLLIYNQGTTETNSSKPGEPIITFDLATDGNYCFTFPLQYSLNPNICVIPFSVAKSDDTKIEEGVIETRYWENILGTSFRNTDNAYVGNLYDIHVNIHFIAGLLKSCTTNNSMPLLRFLETLMDGIQSALGSVNKFTVSYEHDTNKIKIYDDIPLDKSFLEKNGVKDTPESVATFNILGYARNIFEGSFIQNVNLTTTISNQLASMISIGAQAQTPSDVTNATGFMKFNEGLTDSIMPTKVSKVVIEQQAKDNPEKSMAKFYSKLKAKGGIINDLYLQGITPTSEMIDSQQTNAAIIFRSLTSKYSIDEDIPTQSFIPFNLNLQMDGFSGAKIYEKFTINSEILPPGYPDVLNFVIKGLSHNVDVNGWTTNIESLTLAR
jgi:hypothetical protein